MQREKKNCDNGNLFLNIMRNIHKGDRHTANTLYYSSTCNMFVAGVHRSPWHTYNLK